MRFQQPAVLRTTVLHGYRYVTPTQVARRVLASRRTCATRDYLDCCVRWNEVSQLSAEFARVLELPIADPEDFLAWYRKQFHDEQFREQDEHALKQWHEQWLELPQA